MGVVSPRPCSGETVPFRLEVKSKAERGYELLRGRLYEAEKAAEIDIPPELETGEAFRAIAQSCLRQIIANEPAMCAGQAEALHQMRIGLRRLRAAIAIFADVVDDEELETIKGELKWITQELGPARDLDVFAADVLAPVKSQAARATPASPRLIANSRRNAWRPMPAPPPPSSSAAVPRRRARPRRMDRDRHWATDDR